jgi:YggT family protein
VLSQIGIFLVDTVVTFIVLILLARFHFQWLRVPFRNPVGLAWLIQAAGLWLQARMAGADPALTAIAAVAAVDLLRYSLYILVFAVIVQAVLSWVNPYTPFAPVFDALTRPFLRPIRRIVPLLGQFDLSPLVLLVILQVLLFPVNALRLMAASV